MFLTIYYLTETYLQSWRIRTICSKITEKLAEKSSVVFYNLPSEVNDVTATCATSELCTNRSHARISDILWHRPNQRGCSLVPIQSIHLGPWITFPEPPNLIPFDIAINEELDIDESQLVNLLLETDILPKEGRNFEDEYLVKIEEYGKPVAWKIDSHFAVLLITDINHFTKLVMSTFMQDNFTINDSLPLIRIESIDFDGIPQPFDLLKNHLQKQLTSRSMRHLSRNDWEKHLSGLRSLSVLANQATEFEYNKNRTEGKTGIVKPDLIPSKNVEETNHQKISPVKKQNSPKHSPIKIESKISPLKLIPEKPPTSWEHCKLSPEKSIQSSPKLTLVTRKSITKEDIQQKPLELNELYENDTKGILITKPTDKINTPNKSDINLNELITSKIQQPTTSKILPRSPQTPSKTISTNKDNTKRPSLVRNKGSLIAATKPPNVLVYTDSTSVRDSVIDTLRNILDRDTYTIYPLTANQVQHKIWIDNTSLLIICGTVEPSVGEVLLEYFLKGGKMLSICSDILHIILPTYRTAEVREHELVQFSYDKWQKVKMMHHIFCYQPSPVKKHFSHDGEEPPPAVSKKPALVCPRSVEVKDLQGIVHNLDVKILGIEETWNTPSLLLASNLKSGGKAVFSQVHLEADPSQFESDEMKYTVLKQSDKARLEIFTDLLKSYLNVIVKGLPEKLTKTNIYTNAFFLGRHESKFELLEKLKSNMEENNLIRTKNVNLKFCGKGETPPAASQNLLPILVHSCPDDFSTVDYFDNLRSNSIGRIVIYAPVLTSSMHLITGLILTHGIAVIPRQQTEGNGRNNNQWLSPEGCLMFSLQLHIPLDTTFGQRIALVQHLICTAVVHAILNVDGYENLDIGLKWPNDIYANGITKIGGLIVTSQINGSVAICNVGLGINLNNSTPTTCINDLIRDLNKSSNKNLPMMGYEKLLALAFTEIEKLLDRVQSGDVSYLYELYYKYWLHGDQNVTILDKNGRQKEAKIIGIDEFGFLEVLTNNGRAESVHPDGNSFDMLRGLILPK